MCEQAEQIGSYLAARMRQLNRQSSQYRQEDRGDESVFSKVRVNIYGIFQSVYHQCQKDPAASLVAFQNIASSWREKHQKALGRQDYQAAAIEEIKLETAAEIEKAVRSISLAARKKVCHD